MIVRPLIVKSGSDLWAVGATGIAWKTLAKFISNESKLGRIYDRTYFSIIKPDAVKRHLIGAILGRFESQGFRVVALKWCN